MAVIQPRNIGGDHLLQPTGEMPFTKVHSIGESDHVGKEVGPQAKALQDIWNLGATRISTQPVCVDICGLTLGLPFFNPTNSRHIVGSDARMKLSIKPSIETLRSAHYHAKECERL
jgi:hypothetical protein